MSGVSSYRSFGSRTVPSFNFTSPLLIFVRTGSSGSENLYILVKLPIIAFLDFREQFSAYRYCLQHYCRILFVKVRDNFNAPAAALQFLRQCCHEIYKDFSVSFRESSGLSHDYHLLDIYRHYPFAVFDCHRNNIIRAVSFKFIKKALKE